MAIAPRKDPGFSAAVDLIGPDIKPVSNLRTVLPGQHTARRQNQFYRRRCQVVVEAFQKRRAADKRIPMLSAQRRQLFGIPKHRRVQRQA